MTRRTMTERRRRAAERDTRRESLLVLLNRIQRGAPLTPAEAALLRAHVTTETTEGDELRRTVAGQQTAIQRAHDRTRAAEDAITEAEDDAHRAQAQADREQAFARAQAEAARRHLARAQAAALTLARVRNADSLAEALVAVAEHDGLTPAAALAHAAITALADRPDIVLAERDREHAIALATIERRAQAAARSSSQHRATADRNHAAWRSARTRARRQQAEAAAGDRP
ncbi:hypothetical protein ACQEVM_38455 [Streptomyces sp. CA-243310]|uniref:hypothetical protein n=1 Tax=Streptomyces sp. CA-243310 TaxID=3240056 RepID=UPI003D92A1FF